MRISSSLIYQTGLNTINLQQSDLLHLYQQIGSGQRMMTPADDPLAASQAINIAQSQSLNQRYADNRAVANRNLGTEEDALYSLTLLLQDVQTRLVQAGNGTLSDADRGTLARVLQDAQGTALAIANTTDGNGQYLFSGSQGQQPAYGPMGDTYTYRGDALQRNIQADQTRQVAAGDVGIDVFGRAQPGTLAYVTYAGPANAGTGVFSGPVIADRNAGNPAAHYAFDVVFTPGGYDVTVTDRSVDPAAPVGATTSFALAPGATELDLGFGTRVTLSGTPVAGDTLEVRPLRHEDPNLFDSFRDIIAALQAPSQGDAAAQAKLRNVLGSVMQRMDTQYDNVLTVRASIGARMNELAALGDSGTQRGLGYTQALSGLEDLDYYDATMKLSLRKMALEGATAAFQTIQGLSLFNMGGK